MPIKSLTEQKFLDWKICFQVTLRSKKEFLQKDLVEVWNIDTNFDQSINRPWQSLVFEEIPF